MNNVVRFSTIPALNHRGANASSTRTTAAPMPEAAASVVQRSTTKLEYLFMSGGLTVHAIRHAPELR